MTKYSILMKSESHLGIPCSRIASFGNTSSGPISLISTKRSIERALHTMLPDLTAFLRSTLKVSCMKYGISYILWSIKPSTRADITFEHPITRALMAEGLLSYSLTFDHVQRWIRIESILLFEIQTTVILDEKRLPSTTSTVSD